MSMLDFRVPCAVMAVSLMMVPALPAAGGPPRILAEESGRTLTAEHLDAGIDLIQFIVGQPIKKSEVAALEARLIEEFRQMPDEIIRQLADIQGSMRQLHTLTDPGQIGLARQQLFGALYQATLPMPEADKPLMVQVINRYIRVLATDPVQGLLLTDRDADGLLNFLAFMSGLNGQPVALTPELRRGFAQDLARGFPGLAAPQKQVVCAGSVLWTILDARWKRLTPDQQEQFRQQYRMAAAMPPPQPAYPAAPSGAGAGLDAIADAEARQRMFEILSDVSLQQHVTSLNIIENMSDSGNYWEIVDY